MQRIVEAERKPHDQQRAADLDAVEVRQVLRTERPIYRAIGQRGSIDFYDGDINFTGRISALVPDALAITVKQNRVTGGFSNVLGVYMQLDFDSIRRMLSRLIQNHMTASYDEEPLITLKEEAGGISKLILSVESQQTDGGKKNRFNHLTWNKVEGYGKTASAFGFSPLLPIRSTPTI